MLHQCCFLANLFVVTNVISMQRDLTLKQATTYVTIVQLMYGMQVAMRSVTFNVKDQSHSIKLGCFWVRLILTRSRANVIGPFWRVCSTTR